MAKMLVLRWPSAVISVPAREKNFAYISSGTWSVIGTELTAPVIDLSRTDWSNEAGQGGTVRYCRSLMGMWILEECRSQLPSLKGLSYGTLMRLAEEMCIRDSGRPGQHDRHHRRHSHYRCYEQRS